MDTSKLYELDFPSKHKIIELNVATLYHEGRFEELDAVVICKDRTGKVTATFGQNNWDCFPFSRKIQGNNLNFDGFDNTPDLQKELKLISYGWLFNKGPKKKKALSFSGVYSRIKDCKRVYRFLANEGLPSIGALSSPTIWTKFEQYLQEKSYSKITLQRTLIAINFALKDASWHKLKLDILPIEPMITIKKLSNKNEQQTLVIPEHLCDSIYSKAIELIKVALPFAHLIANTEHALQTNYIEGKQSVDEKVKQGHLFIFINGDESINNHKYARAIKDNQPQDVKSIIKPLAAKLPNVPLQNGNEFRRYLGQLITASYIVCGGFSGMRASELEKLTPDSYYKDTFNGRDYHMLQSHTFKLGEKRATWVTAASTEISIKLMTILTKNWRKETSYPDPKYINSLWLNQGARSKPPKLITHWNERLQLFCKQLGFNVTQKDYQDCLESNPRSLERVHNDVTVGAPWPLSTHQFRRTLAFYCIKYRLGTLVALKQQFKHLYLAMTEWYTNGGKLASLRDLKVDEQVQKALDEINAETTANKIFKQWHSDETLSGTHGKAIMKMRGDVPTIYSSWDVIYKAVKDGKLTLHGSMHSYCKSGYDCDMDGVVTPQFCVECGSGSSIIDEQQAKWWQKKHRSLVAYMESGEEISISEHSHYVTQVRAAEKVMADFDMPFTPFEPDLKVANL
ncbi:hypothetical protein DDM91_15555 [Vibrio cholerae]|nr:hypothetical protein [Vibrio cholerae]